MYQERSITTVPEPLSAGLMTMSVRFMSFVRALRSCFERLLWIVAGLEVMMSFSTALMKVSGAASLPLGGVHDPLHRKLLLHQINERDWFGLLAGRILLVVGVLQTHFVRVQQRNRRRLRAGRRLKEHQDINIIACRRNRKSTMSPYQMRHVRSHAQDIYAIRESWDNHMILYEKSISVQPS